MIKLSNVNVEIENNIILQDINLEVHKGDFLAILGPNGGGKTTLVKLMLGIITPTSGTVEKRKKLNIGYVPQFSTFKKQFPIKVYDVVLSGRVSSGLKLFKKYNEADKNAADEILKKLGIDNLRNRVVSKLSGGELQKVLIARALVDEPEVIILDEPTASLDKDSKTEIYNMLKTINDKITVIIISHDTHVISKYTEKIFCVNKTAHCHVNTKEHFEKIYGEDMRVIEHIKLEGHDE